eukprot:gene14781-10571_t
MSRVFQRCDSLLQSVQSLYEVYQRLHDGQVEAAVLPVAIKSGLLNVRQYMKHDAFLFPLLSNEFRMGLPLDDDDHAKYLKALRDAYKKMHAAGVVHLDGYPSNILWKKADDTIVIKFVDFDVASRVNCAFDSNIHGLLTKPEFASSCYYWHEATTASEKHDAWFVFIFSQTTRTERKESFEAGLNRSADGVVTNYWKVVARLRQAGTIVNDFLRWFDTNWNL